MATLTPRPLRSCARLVPTFHTQAVTQAPVSPINEAAAAHPCDHPLISLICGFWGILCDPEQMCIKNAPCSRPLLRPGTRSIRHSCYRPWSPSAT